MKKTPGYQQKMSLFHRKLDLFTNLSTLSTYFDHLCRHQNMLSSSKVRFVICDKFTKKESTLLILNIAGI